VQRESNFCFVLAESLVKILLYSPFLFQVHHASPTVGRQHIASFITGHIGPLRGSLVEFNMLNEAVMLKQVVFLGLVSAAVLPGNILGAFNHEDHLVGGRQQFVSSLPAIGRQPFS
jgi:hypothetical protein